MKTRTQLLILVGLGTLVLGVLLVLSLRPQQQTISATPVASLQSVTPSPTEFVSTQKPLDSSGVAVTPPGLGEPTVPPAALVMHAAPTGTPGSLASLTPTLTPTPTPTAYPTLQSVPSNGHDNVLTLKIPAGEFLMGFNQREIGLWVSQASQFHLYTGLNFADTAPQMQVNLSEYAIDQIEVTNHRYRTCVQASVCESSKGHIDGVSDYATNPSYDDYPVLVNWFQASTYCQWAGKHLPTEAEWEKAARGIDGRAYPWSDDWDPQKGALETKPLTNAGSFPNGASPYGVLDMAGNADEWTTDVYQPYPQRNALYNLPSDQGLEVDQMRTVRGIGKFQYDAYVTVRVGMEPLYYLAGFRCVSKPEAAKDWRNNINIVDNIPTPVPTLVPIAQPDISTMVYVPAGWFTMGTSEVATDPESQHRGSSHVVYLGAYYIDQHETTLAEYAKFLNALPTPFRACDGYDCTRKLRFDAELKKYTLYEGQHENWPITGVTWYSADAYCRWLGKRLPTEAEWEKAARGTDGRRYPWGDDEREDAFASMVGTYGESVLRDIQSVPLDVSPYGVWDTLGSVPEWVADWYDPNYYVISPARNPTGPETGQFRVIRSHTGDQARLGIDWRDASAPTVSDYEGFRCAYTHPHP